MSENEKKILDLSVSMPTEQEPQADIWGDDALGREKFAGDLTRIVKNAAEHKSFTLSLHGDWGTGKTYLLQRWQKQLQKEGRQAVYFNAWEDDFQADPLTAIVGQLWKEIKKGDFAEIGESLKSLVGHLGKKVLGVAGATKEDFQSPAERTVDEYLAVREKLDGLKERLEKLAKAVKDSTGFSLVFIVDELDRCRPTFAIEVLERVKHLFNAPNIVFVFGINKTELQKSIQSAYGDINAEDYLRRFFDIGLTLPPADTAAYCRHLLMQYDLWSAISQVGKMPFTGGTGEWDGAVRDMPNRMVGHMEFSLREVEHVVRLFRFAVNARIASEQSFGREGWYVFLLILLKIKKPALYAKFAAGKPCCVQVVDYFHGFLPGALQGKDPFGNEGWFADFIEERFYYLACQFSHGDWKDIRADLLSLDNGASRSSLKFLSQRIKSMDEEYAKRYALNMWKGAEEWKPSIKNIFPLLDLADNPR